MPCVICRNDKSYKGKHSADWSGYADDLELFCKDQHSLEKALKIMDRIFKRFMLKINVSKTKTMIFNFQGPQEEYPESFTALNNIAVENVKIFRYLGDQIKHDQPNTGDEEVSLRCSMAEVAFNIHKKKLTNQKILLKTRVQLLNSLVRSRLTYSCQTWNLTVDQERIINGTYVRFLR